MLGNGDGTFAARPCRRRRGSTLRRDRRLQQRRQDGPRREFEFHGRYYYGLPQGQLDVLLAIGDGSFAAPRTFWTMDRALGSVVVTDFNGDGNRTS